MKKDINDLKDELRLELFESEQLVHQSADILENINNLNIQIQEGEQTEGLLLHEIDRVISRLIVFNNVVLEKIKDMKKAVDVE